MGSAHIEQTSDGTIAVRGALKLDTVSMLVDGVDFKRLVGMQAKIDLSGVEGVDSAGVALCLDWIVQAKDAGVELMFLGLPEQMQRLVSMNSLDDLFVEAGGL